MRCPDLENLERHVSGELAPDESQRVEDHLSSCATCSGLLEEIEHHAEVIETLRGYHRERALPARSTHGLPEYIGAYRILEEVGRGGMGVVYRAEQERPHREVALKVVHPGLVSPKSLRRFELEVEVLGRLEHAGIARIFDAGTAEVWSEPQPFFAMEYVRGRRVRDYCADEGLGLDQVLGLFVEVCEAVHHAHLRGVIHRDVKPGNILVGEDGHPKVIDFGLARVSDPDLRSISAHTEVGNVLGTLPYMAPEQLGDDPDSVDARADVYGLGAVLYQLVSGRPPLELEGLGLPRAALRIAEDIPPPPSSVQRGLPRELDWICLRALEKDPDRRYESVAEMAADLRRFRRHEPVTAGPPSSAYRLSLFVRRHRIGVAVSAGALLALLFAFFNVTFAKEDAQRSALEERLARERMESLLSFSLENIGDMNPDEAGDLDSAARREHELEQLEQLTERVDAEFGDDPVIAARLWTMLARNYLEWGMLERAQGLLESARDTQMELLGREHVDTAETLHGLGGVYVHLGRRSEAEKLILDAVEVRRDLLGPDHEDVHMAANSLGSLYHMSGRHEEAERLWLAALPALERVYGSDDKRTLMLLGNIGSLHIVRGRYAEAERVLTDVMERREEALGPDHPHTVNGRMALARLYLHLDRPDEAVGLQERAVQAMIERYGPDHHELFKWQNALAATYYQLDRFDEATELFESVHERRRAVLGPAHPETLASLRALGEVFRMGGRFQEALPVLREVLEATAGLRAEATERLMAKSSLGTLYLDLGRYDEAEPLLAETLAAQRRLLPEGPRDVLTSLNNLARLYRKEGRYADAEALSEEAIELAERTQGPEKPLTLSSMFGLAVAYRLHGRLEEAEEQMLHVLDVARRNAVDEQFQLSFQRGFAELQLDQGRLEPALESATEVLEEQRALYRPDHPETLRTVALVADIRAALGDDPGAAELYVDVVDRAGSVFGEDHPITLEALTGLAELRADEGRWQDAHGLAARASQLTDQRDGEHELRRALLARIEEKLAER